MAMTMTAATASGDTIQLAVRALCLAALLAVCTHVGATSYDVKDGRHNITMGARRYHYPHDALLFHDVPKVGGSWFPYPQVKSHDVCYPPKNYKDPRRISITMYNVTDLVPRGEGGYAYVTKGGVNSGNVCFHLKSQRGNGYHFEINIFGYYL